MSDKIEFYFKDSGKIYEHSDDYLFVMNDRVYRDNDKMFESQEALIGFDDCIEEFSHIGWRIK